jgi:hypothetical protein
MQLKSWKKILLAAAIVVVPIVSCSQRSLVLMDVTVSGTSMFSDATLVVTANDDQKTTFAGVALNQTPYRAGVYLPSDMTGQVMFKAEVDEGNCIVGTGSAMLDVSGGGTMGPIDLIITPMVPCVPITDGGQTGGGGTGGTSGTAGHGGGGSGATGSGGMTGSAGTSGSGGMTGSAGAGGMTAGSGGKNGTAGSGGSGGLTGSAGAGGRTGTAGSGGSSGSAGRGGTTGSAGRGGIGGGASGGRGGIGNGAGGTGGTVSPVGTGGTVSPVGTAGSAMAGSMGRGGTLGLAGTSGCICPANETCNAAGACVCNQTDAQACAAAGIGCGTASNICQQKVLCKCPANSTCDPNTGLCSISCVTGTGGDIVMLDENGQAIICPL